MYNRYLTGMFLNCKPSRSSGHSLTKSCVNCTHVLFFGGCLFGIRFLSGLLGWCWCIRVSGHVFHGRAFLFSNHFVQLVEKYPTFSGIAERDHYLVGLELLDVVVVVHHGQHVGSVWECLPAGEVRKLVCILSAL